MGLVQITWLGLAAVLGAAAWHAWSAWRAQRIAKERRRIPKHWPLEPRKMANSEERRVWRWLSRVFFDQHVMIKVPVTRFTLPSGGENSEHWFQLLSGVYCTFTICGPDGNVVGCVDVPGPKGLSRNNQKLKLTLLSQCGIAYWVIRPENFPTLAEIRMDVLGETAGMPSASSNELAVNAARQNLQAAIGRQRYKRMSDEALMAKFKKIADAGGESLLSDSGFASSGWQQPNSFIAPLDSRPVELR